jgi:hypothetical protein
MSGIKVQLAGSFRKGKTVRTPADLPLRVNGEYAEFAVPRLTDYELVVLE